MLTNEIETEKTSADARVPKGALEHNLRGRRSSGIRIALLSLALYALLTAAKFLLYHFTDSAALLAEAVHSLTDVIGTLLVLAGIVLAEKRSERFPWGLYKAENLAALILSGFIFLSAYEIAGLIVRPPSSDMQNLDAGIAALAVVAVPVWLFARYERIRAGTINSPSLLADAAHWKADLAPLLVVAAGLIGARLSYTVMDRIAAAVVLVTVVRAGYGILRDSAKSLLDASIDRTVLDDIQKTIDGFRDVKEVLVLQARNSGRFVFVEANVTLSVRRLREAHGIACSIEDAIRARVPFVERVTIRYQPELKDVMRYAVPLADSEGLLSAHFGSAPFIAVWEQSASTGRLLTKEILQNPFATLEKGKGRELAKMLVEQRIDVLFTKESLKGKGPDFVLSNAGIDMKETDVNDLKRLTER